MQRHPFALFRQFPELEVTLLAKEDHARKGDDLEALLGTKAIATVRQVHGCETIVAHESMEEAEDADGIATDRPGLAIAVYMADCQTFVFYAPRERVIGVLHAGWKGLLAGAIPAHITLLGRKWGIDPREVLVGAGPSLCLACSEFTDPEREIPGIDAGFFHGHHADLRGIADAQLLACGLAPSHIERHPDCTRCNPDTYWSYRGPDRELVRQGWENMITCMLAP